MSDQHSLEQENEGTVTSIWCNDRWHHLHEGMNDNPNSPSLVDISVGNKDGILIAQLFYSNGSVTVVPWHQIKSFHVEKAKP